MIEGLTYGLVAALLLGSADVFAALATRGIGSLRTLVIVLVTSLLPMAAFALVTTGGIPFGAATAIPATVLGVLSAIAYLCFYVALRYGPVAVVSPVSAAYGSVTVVLAVVFLGERLTPNEAVGVVVAAVGIILVSLHISGGYRSARFVGPGVPLAIIACLTWGVVTVGTTALVREAEVLEVILVSRLASAVLIVAAVAWRELRARSRDPESDEPIFDPDATAPRPNLRRALAFALVAGILDGANFPVFATGLQRSEAWLVGLVSSFGPSVAVFVAIWLLGDRLQRTQWAGLGALALGVVLIGLR